MTKDELKIYNRDRMRNKRAKIKAEKNTNPEAYEKWIKGERVSSIKYYESNKRKIQDEAAENYVSRYMIKEEGERQERMKNGKIYLAEKDEAKRIRAEDRAMLIKQGYKDKLLIGDMLDAMEKGEEEHEINIDYMDHKTDRHDDPHINNGVFPKRDNDGKIVATCQAELDNYLEYEEFLPKKEKV